MSTCKKKFYWRVGFPWSVLSYFKKKKNKNPVLGCVYDTWWRAVAIKYSPSHPSVWWDTHLPSQGTSEHRPCSGWLRQACTAGPLSTLGPQLTDGDFLVCWFWQSDQISQSNFVPAAFDRFIYYIVLNYLWLCCNKAHPCLILLPLEDHLH